MGAAFGIDGLGPVVDLCECADARKAIKAARERIAREQLAMDVAEMQMAILKVERILAANPKVGALRFFGRWLDEDSWDMDVIALGSVDDCAELAEAGANKAAMAILKVVERWGDVIGQDECESSDAAEFLGRRLLGVDGFWAWRAAREAKSLGQAASRPGKSVGSRRV